MHVQWLWLDQYEGDNVEIFIPSVIQPKERVKLERVSVGGLAVEFTTGRKMFIPWSTITFIDVPRPGAEPEIRGRP
jgi:hypothetical protein